MDSKGGLAKGKSHREGGIKAKVKSTGQMIEFEGGEVIINKTNVADPEKYEFEGQEKTTCEILSDLNSAKGNGVTLECDTVEGKKYKYAKGGEVKKIDNKLIISDKNGNEYVYADFVGNDTQYLIPYIDTPTRGKKYWEHHFIPKDTWIDVRSINDFSVYPLSKDEFEELRKEGRETHKKILEKYHNSFAKGGSTDNNEVRTMELGDAVIYNDKTHYIRYENDQVYLVDNSQGAWGISGRKIPLTSIIQDDLTDMYGNKVFIPYSFQKGGSTDNQQTLFEVRYTNYSENALVNDKNAEEFVNHILNDPDVVEVTLLKGDADVLYGIKPKKTKRVENYIRYDNEAMELENEANYPENWREREAFEKKAEKKKEMAERLLSKMNAGELIALGEQTDIWYIDGINDVYFNDILGIKKMYQVDKKFKKGGMTYKDKYNKKYGYKKGTSHDLEDISKDTGVSEKGLKKIFDKGVGAYYTNPQSVRPNVKSPEQWAYGRVYSAVMGGKASKVDAKELKMETGGNLPMAKQGNDIAQVVIEKFEEYKNTKNKLFLEQAGNELNRYFQEAVAPDPYNFYKLLQLSSILPKKQRFDLYTVKEFDKEKYLEFVNNLTVNPYTLIPEKLKSNKKVKALPRPQFNIDNDSFTKIMSPFVGKDDLRPIMMTSQIFEKGAVGTDAHRLLFIKGNPSKEEYGQICVEKNCIQYWSDKAGIGKKDESFDKKTSILTTDIRYPNFDAVVPNDFEVELNNIDAEVIYNYCLTLLNNGLVSRTTYGGLFTTEDKAYSFGVNLNYFAEGIKALMQLGHKKIAIGFTMYSASEYVGDYKFTTTPIIITGAGELTKSKFDRDFVLCMPVLVNTYVNESMIGFIFNLSKQCVDFGHSGVGDVCVDPDVTSFMKERNEIEELKKEIEELKAGSIGGVTTVSELEMEGLKVLENKLTGKPKTDVDKYISKVEVVKRKLKPISNDYFYRSNTGYRPTKGILKSFVKNGYLWLIANAEYKGDLVVFEDVSGASLMIRSGWSVEELEKEAKRVIDKNADALDSEINKFGLSPRYSSETKTFKEDQEDNINEKIAENDYDYLWSLLSNRANKTSRQIFSKIIGTNIKDFNDAKLNELFINEFGVDILKGISDKAKKEQEEADEKEREYWQGLKSKYPKVNMINDDNKTVGRIIEQLDKRKTYDWGVGTVGENIERTPFKYKKIFVSETTKDGTVRKKPLVEYWISENSQYWNVVPKLIWDRLDLEIVK